MGLFSRKKKADEVSSPDQDVDTPDVADEYGDDVASDLGPFDEADQPELGDLLDAGALRIPAVDAATIQFSVDQGREVVLGAVYLLEQSAVQLQVFASPKTASLWEDIRAELISSIANQGGSSREHVGEYGSEVRAQMPSAGKGKAVQPVRYIGIDGPRWLLRVTVTGRAAVDEKVAARVLHAVLDQTVVVRGQTPFPPREILPLTVPRPNTEKEEKPSLALPKRGPEIQEVR